MSVAGLNYIKTKFLSVNKIYKSNILEIQNLNQGSKKYNNKLTKFEMETAYTEFLELADERKLLHDEDLYELMEKRNGQ